MIIEDIGIAFCFVPIPSPGRDPIAAGVLVCADEGGRHQAASGSCVPPAVSSFRSNALTGTRSNPPIRITGSSPLAAAWYAADRPIPKRLPASGTEIANSVFSFSMGVCSMFNRAEK
jgi:hypothetical protein